MIDGQGAGAGGRVALLRGSVVSGGALLRAWATAVVAGLGTHLCGERWHVDLPLLMLGSPAVALGAAAVGLWAGAPFLRPRAVSWDDWGVTESEPDGVRTAIPWDDAVWSRSARAASTDVSVRIASRTDGRAIAMGSGAVPEAVGARTDDAAGLARLQTVCADRLGPPTHPSDDPRDARWPRWRSHWARPDSIALALGGGAVLAPLVEAARASPALALGGVAFFLFAVAERALAVARAWPEARALRGARERFVARASGEGLVLVEDGDGRRELARPGGPHPDAALSDRVGASVWVSAAPPTDRPPDYRSADPREGASIAIVESGQVTAERTRRIVGLSAEACLHAALGLLLAGVAVAQLTTPAP